MNMAENARGLLKEARGLTIALPLLQELSFSEIAYSQSQFGPGGIIPARGHDLSLR